MTDGQHPPPHDEQHKPSVQYNLEKEPLQTGQTQPDVGLRARFATMMDRWLIHRWSWWGLWTILVLLLLACGAMAIMVVNRFFAGWSKLVGGG